LKFGENIKASVMFKITKSLSIILKIL